MTDTLCTEASTTARRIASVAITVLVSARSGCGARTSNASVVRWSGRQWPSAPKQPLWPKTENAPA